MIQKKISFPPLKKQKTTNSNDDHENDEKIAESKKCNQQYPKNQEVIELLSSSDEDEDEKVERNIHKDCFSTGSRKYKPEEKKGGNVIPKTQTTNESVESPNGLSSSAKSLKRANDSGEIIKSPKQNNKHTRSDVLTYRTSAYVQNLAEICHDILYDERWRTIDNKKQLFLEDAGDNVQVLNAFAELFVEASGENENEEVESSIYDDSNESSRINDENYVRCIHLYSRLFYRKGPWFHLSDIFVRYYHRDYIRHQSHDKHVVFDQEQDERDSAQNDHRDNDYDMTKKAEKLKSCKWIEDCLNDCLHDIHRLLHNGFSRCFRSEEECGIVVGNKESLCTKKEKDSILRQLGGKSSNTKSASRQSSANKDFDALHGTPKKKAKRASRVPGVNEILKQMKNQRPLFAYSKNALLPVEKHVTNILMQGFAQKIVSISNYKSIHDVICLIESSWKKITATHGTQYKFPICCRLKEEPLLALRRASRLYICGGNGPGSMRSDGSNGWLTVIESLPVADDVSEELQKPHSFVDGVCTLPKPPSVSQWNRVTFAGLNYRLGLLCCNFIENHKRIPAAKQISGKGQCETTSVKYRCPINIFKDIKSFHLWEECVLLRNQVDYLIEWNSLVLYADRKIKSTASKNVSKSIALDDLSPEMSNDFDLLSESGRGKRIQEFIKKSAVGTSVMRSIQEQVEKAISSCNLICSKGCGDSFLTNAERNICSLGFICQNILLYFLPILKNDEMFYLIDRPWLRHLSWQSSMAYILWDCIEIFEKRGYYEIAVDMLETILYGHLTKNAEKSKMSERKVVNGFMQVLLSRRVRGKAYDRLVLDKKHIIQKSKEKSKKKTKTKLKEKKKNIFEAFVEYSMKDTAAAASIPFRWDIWNNEMLELGIRLHCTKMKEWSPSIDFTIANALNDSSVSGTGKRCSYVGNEDLYEEGVVDTRSLTVEELALEEYALGKLPSEQSLESSISGGGWKGWHTEGLHVRVLFRILVFESLLAYDFYHGEGHQITQHSFEQMTIFLNPYQTCPLDLHVGHCLLQISQEPIPIRSFYERRRKQIEQFFDELSSLSPQALSNLVYDCIITRKKKLINSGRSWKKNSQLLRDIKELKILSMLAAGFGGELLAAMFRCLCYDYRHYSGGMPDLTLIRATQNIDNDEDNHVDWGAWIGEEFANDQNQKNKVLLLDRDDEFLGGCLNEKQTTSSSRKGYVSLNDDEMCLPDPERLDLSFSCKPVKLQAMFVEVKSANDTLDDRQEDWLNIICNRGGEARVCKFKSSQKKRE